MGKERAGNIPAAFDRVLNSTSTNWLGGRTCSQKKQQTPRVKSSDGFVLNLLLL